MLLRMSTPFAGSQPGDIVIGRRSIEVDYRQQMIPDAPKPEAVSKKLVEYTACGLQDNPR
jgi:hypothetical protein